VLGMIPGMSQALGKVPKEALQDDAFKHVEAIIKSMTPKERRNPDVLNGSRRLRIARGSGTAPADVNQVIAQFNQMRKMMKQMSGMMGKGGKMPRIPGLRF
jgi:signal recognition particle subunit SRP54